MTQLSLDDLGAPRRLTRAELMAAREVAALLEVPISTVLEWGPNGTLSSAGTCAQFEHTSRLRFSTENSLGAHDAGRDELRPSVCPVVAAGC